MGFTKYIEIGRVVCVASGRYKGRICVIVNVIDQNRILVDGPVSGVPRQVLNLKNVHVTKIKIGIPHTAPTRLVRSQWLQKHVDLSWNESLWCRKLRAKERSQTLTDFERFKLRRLQKERKAIYSAELKAVKGELKQKRKQKMAKKDASKKATKKPVKKTTKKVAAK